MVVVTILIKVKIAPLVHKVTLKHSACMAGHAASEGLPKAGLSVLDVAIPVHDITKGETVMMLRTDAMVIIMHTSGRRCLVRSASVVVIVDIDSII